MESVLSQEGVSLEFIVIDDESTGVIDGPTHHGSVMFRREAYVRGGRLQSGVLLCSGLGPLVSSSGVFLNDAAHHHPPRAAATRSGARHHPPASGEERSGAALSPVITAVVAKLPELVRALKFIACARI